MRSIVLGTDFSDASTGAAEIAVSLAHRFGDRIVLVHVMEPLDRLPPADSAIELIAPLATELRNQAMRQLIATAGELRARGVAVEEQLLTGVTDEMLVCAARQAEARLLVVGTHGRGAFGRLLFGVAERVLELAECPVVFAGSRPADGVWSSGGRPLRVAVAVDPSRPSLAAVEWVRQLRAQGPCDVLALHVYHPLGLAFRYGLFTEDEVDQPAAALQLLERDVKQLVGELPGGGTVEIQLEPAGQHPGAVVANAARERAADLLVLGTHQHRGRGHRWGASTAEVALRAGTVPVLAVPAQTPVPGQSRVTPIRSVLAATDLSESGNQVVPLAFGMVNVPGGVVHLCHVVSEGSPEPEEVAGRLFELVPADAAARGIVAQVQTPRGDPCQLIPELSNRLGVQVVCLSTGKDKVGRVAQSVVREAHRPVLVIPAGD